MNYLKLGNKNLFYYTYFYFDILLKDYYYADRIFAKNNLKVKYIIDYEAPNTSIYAHIVKIKKKDEKLFLQCMKELSDKMLVLGYTDYPENCQKMIETLTKEI